MHIYIVSPYYLQSFMKFCCVVSEKLGWQTVAVVYFGQNSKLKGHNSYKKKS